MEYQKNEVYSFKVKGTKRSGQNLFYTINVNGSESYVKVYEFQKNNAPAEIKCICKGKNENDQYFFMQDIADIISQLYKVGDIKEFKVKNEFPTRGYYDVVDDNDICCRMIDAKGERLTLHQKVQCRILEINKVRVNVELVVNNRNYGLAFLTMDDLLRLDTSGAIHPRYLRILLQKLPQFSDIRREQNLANPLWVVHLVELIDKYMSKWLVYKIKNRPNLKCNKCELLQAFRSICVNLLENSLFLKNAKEKEKIGYQNKFSKIIDHIEDYMQALRLVNANSAVEYVEDTLNRLSTSGFLYHPDRKMRVMMAAFSLDKQMMRQFIRQIFDVITDEYSNSVLMNQFRHPFMKILALFINQFRQECDAAYKGNLPTVFQDVVKALALHLLMDQEYKIYNPNCNIYKSMLYRYSSMLVSVESSSKALISKSWDALMSYPSFDLEYSWKDMSNINLFCSKLATRILPTRISPELKIFDSTNGATLKLAGRSMVIMPTDASSNPRSALPSGLFTPHEIKVLLNDKTSEKPTSVKPTLRQYQLMWKEIEKLMFARQIGKRPTVTKRYPEIGEDVYVRVIGVSKESQYDLLCKIEDDNYKGIGVFNPAKNFASYAIRTNPEFFADENGHPYLFRTRVEAIEPNGLLRFNMRPCIAAFNLKEMELGSQCVAQVTRVDERQYLCIGESGDTLFVPRIGNEDILIQLDDLVVVTVDAVYPDGKIKCSIDSLAENQYHFDRATAFCQLVRDFSEEKTFEGNTANDWEEMEHKQLLEPQYVKEIMRVADRIGLSFKERTATYNYLALAHLIAVLVEDEEMVKYYEKRMKMVEAITLFAENGSIEEKTMDSLLNDDSELISMYPDLMSRLTQIRIVNQLDNHSQGEFLWKLSTQTVNKKEMTLAQLVLAYNLLAYNNVVDIRKELKKRIYDLIGVEMRTDNKLVVAVENQFTELKTSIIYPADKENNMYANEKLQIEEIMKVVCSFMNAKGGTVYIGVSDAGVAVGLDADFAYLNKGFKEYDINNVRDIFDRRVRDAVYTMLGVIANNRITSSFEQIDGQWVYKLDVEPSPEIIKLNNVAYVRQGTSKYPIPESKLATFRKNRDAEFNK